MPNINIIILITCNCTFSTGRDSKEKLPFIKSKNISMKYVYYKNNYIDNNNIFLLGPKSKIREIFSFFLEVYPILGDLLTYFYLYFGIGFRSYKLIIGLETYLQIAN